MLLLMIMQEPVTSKGLHLHHKFDILKFGCNTLGHLAKTRADNLCNELVSIQLIWNFIFEVIMRIFTCLA